MSAFDLIEISFGPKDFETSLEDDFTLTRLENELKAVTDIEQLRSGAILLLKLAVMRQSMIRGLVRRLGEVEKATIRTQYED
jgi:hypothetical protein